MKINKLNGLNFIFNFTIQTTAGKAKQIKVNNTVQTMHNFDWMQEKSLKHHQGFHCGVFSFFDGLHHQHRALLEYGLKLAGGAHSKLLVVVALENTMPAYSSKELLLVPEERGSLIARLGFQNLALVSLPNHSTYGAKKSCLEIVAEKTGLLVPGPDIFEQGSKQERHPLDLLQKQFPSLKMDKSFSRKFEKDVSPEIAALIASGNLEEAFRNTGYAFFLKGLVVEGNKIGRTLGYPTANLKPAHPQKVVPEQGVYAALVKVEDAWYQSMVNIGIRPTLDLENVTIEAHLFDFNGNIYGQEITIHFIGRIRNEMRFTSLSELKDQLSRDQQNTRKKLRKYSEEIIKAGNFVFSTELPAKEI